MKELSKRHRDSMAPVIINELRSMAAQNEGLLMPEQVVEAARSEDSPLHSKFTWDDTKAAERYRIWQARALLSICVEYIPSGGKSVPTKVFVSLSTDRGKNAGGYRTLVEVMRDPDQRNQMLMDSLAAMNHFQERYKQLQELHQVFGAMRKVQSTIHKKIKAKHSDA